MAQRELERLVGDGVTAVCPRRRTTLAGARAAKHAHAVSSIARSLLFAFEGLLHLALAAPTMIPKNSAAARLRELACDFFT